MRLLVIEDHQKTTLYLQQGLSEAGFIVDIAFNGMEGLHLAETTNYDLIILDIMLPQYNGWTVIKKLHEAGKTTPVLFLTARDSVEDRVKGLELGADDYLVKPFAFSELLARVRTLLRRGQQRQQEIIKIADLELDLLRHKAFRNGIRLNLTPKEFALLSLLARREGEVLSRTLIAEQVWDMNFDSDTNVVDVAIRRLRQKVDEPFAVKLIHTIRSIGYVLEQR